MHITRKRCHLENVFVIFRQILLLFSGFFILLGSQKALTQNNDLLKLKVSINTISLNRDFEVHGLVADFPFPILSTISVLDSSGVPITGLADTARWLGADETAEIGSRISDIWQPVLEYHHENPDLPASPNVFFQQPQPLFTEIREAIDIPVRTMLLMDASWSMRKEITNAVEGARSFVRMMRSNDEVGIIVFDDQIIANQPITADTTQLMAVLNTAQARGRTGLYDALILAIQQLKNITGKRSIIVYADGEDNASIYTKEDVVDSALYYNTSIFTIAYGTGANPDTLKAIADSTGGLFFQTDANRNIEDIYRHLSQLIHNFYIMAHTSTDPVYNNTWRVVDVTVNTASGSGQGTGRYFVQGTGPFTDVSIGLSSVSDTAVVVNGETLRAVEPGNNFQYTLTVRNLNAEIARNLKMIHILPDHVQFINASEQARQLNSRMLSWELDELAPGNEIELQINVFLPDSDFTNMTQLKSQAYVYVDNDSSLQNNTDIDSITVLNPPAPPVEYKFDLSLSQEVETDSLILINGDSIQVVLPGQQYRYQLQIQNLGPVTAHEIKLWDILSDSVDLFNFSVSPDSQVQDTLFWLIDSLLAGQSMAVEFQARLTDSLIADSFQVINRSGVFARLDSLLDNNFAETNIMAIPFAPIDSPDVDISVTQFTKTDSFVVISGDTVHYAQSGETYQYHVLVQNPSKGVARNVVIIDSIPEFVSVDNFNQVPVQNSNRKITWEIDQLPPDSIFIVTFNATLPVAMPTGENLLINRVQIQAANEHSEFLGNNSVVDTVFNIVNEPEPPVDVAVRHYVKTDSFAIVAGDTIRYAKSGETYHYQLRIQNPSDGVAQNIVITDSIPNFVTVVNFNIPPVQNAKRKIIWEVGQLLPDSIVQITFDATLPMIMPVGENLLINQVQVSAQNEDSTYLKNNSVVDTVINIQSQPQFPVDVSVLQFIKTDSMAIMAGDTVHFVKSGETYQYQILIRNQLEGIAQNIVIIDSLPAFILTSQFNRPPDQNTNRKLIWEIPQLMPDSSIFIKFNASVPFLMPLGENLLINQVQIQVQNESPEYLDNNSTIDTVFNIQSQPQLPVDVSVSQLVKTDSFIVNDGDTTHYAKSGETYHYFIQIENLLEGVAQNIMVTDSIPEFVSVSNFNIQPVQKENRKVTWQINRLRPDSMLFLSFEATVPVGMPLGENLLINQVVINAQNEAEEYRSNNVVIDTVVNIQSAPPVDISVIQFTDTDSFTVIAGDTIHFAKSGETYQYRIRIQNISEGIARNLIVADSIPQFVTTNNFNHPPVQNANRKIVWEFGQLMPDSTISIQFDATVPAIMPIGENLLINQVRIQAQNEGDPHRGNNSVTDTVYNIQSQIPIGDLSVSIGTLPRKIEVGEPITIEIEVSNPVQTWDIWVYLANGEIEKNFADELVSTIMIQPGIKITLPIKYTNTRLYSSADHEEIRFELIVTDIAGNTARSSTSVEIYSSNDFVLERNVYQPESEESLGINFKLSTNRQAKLDVYDLAGSHVTQLTDAFYPAGWNTYYWNGWTQNGMKVGSGLYLITLKSDPYNAYKKVMIVR